MREARNPRTALVGEEGFEPSVRRIKTCCLTTWLLPRRNGKHSAGSRPAQALEFGLRGWALE